MEYWGGQPVVVLGGGGGLAGRACGVGGRRRCAPTEVGDGRVPWPEQGRKMGADKWTPGLQCRAATKK
jgi:hypothetical protein